MPQYLFVLCPPYCGSTLLWKLLSTSDNVSALPNEGQFLPEVEGIMRERPWDKTNTLPWETIKTVWEGYWDQSKPVLLEKSPPNILRAPAIAEHFQPVQFVLMVRNPYAHAEGLMRRNNFHLRRAANFSLMCLRTQLQNAQELENSLVITYEQLVQDPVQACKELATFQPALSDMDPQASFEVHSVDGTVDRQITDLNAKKIASLSAADLAGLNEFFVPAQEVLNAWGYELIEHTPPA